MTQGILIRPQLSPTQAIQDWMLTTSTYLKADLDGISFVSCAILYAFKGLRTKINW